MKFHTAIAELKVAVAMAKQVAQVSSLPRREAGA